MSRLGPTGLTQLLTDIKNWVLSKIPTKTSQLTNDSNFLTSHQSLSNYVNLNGNQTITGDKTFSKAQPIIILSMSGATKTTNPSSQLYGNIFFQDKTTGIAATKRAGSLDCGVNASGQTEISMRAFNWGAANNTNVGIGVCYPRDGTAYTYAPTPATADNSTQIATTAFVKAQGYITGSGNTTGSSGSCTGNAATASKVVATVANDNTGALVQGTMGSNDCFRIAIGGASNAGWAEIATGDDYNEPIYVRQYKGSFATLQRTATLLDASGNTSFPGTVTATGFSGPLTGNVTGNCSGSSGSCTGNAATATKATGNANGKELTDTIIKGLSISGKTITYTQIDGTTGTLTTQDNNTDTKVTQTVSTTDNTYPILASATANASATGTTTSVFGTGVKLNPSKGIITANGLSGTQPATTYVAAVADGGALVNSKPTSFGAVWRAPTKNYQVAGATFPSSNDTVYICYSVTNDNVTAGTNTVAKQLIWAADTGTLTANAFSGNASSATQFSDNTTVALTGDATGTSAGSKKGWSVPVTLANSGVTAGSYGPTADVTGNNNATISVPQITVDAKGRVTSVVNRTLTCKNNTYSVYNKTLTIQKNGTNVATFTSNSNTDVTANITVPTKTSELTNDSGFLTSHQSLSNYVTLNGTQTISGVKTISAKNVKYTASVTRGTAPSAAVYKQPADYVDSAGNRIFLLETVYNTDKSSKTGLYAYNTTAATGNSIGNISIGCDTSGNVYTQAPTPATSDNSTKIATTAFVKAQGFLTSHQSLNSCVKTTDNQLIAGWKQFTSDICVKNTAITDHTAAPSADTSRGLGFWDNNNKYWGDINHTYLTTGASEIRICMTNWSTSGSQGWWCLRFGVDKNFSQVYFIPNGNATYNLGNTSHKWNATYAQEYHAYNANAFMANQGGYTFLIRNDGGSTYFLMSAQNGNEGTWTNARPLTIVNSTGVCNINGNCEGTAHGLQSSLTQYTDGVTYAEGQITVGTAAGNAYKGSSNNAALISFPENGTANSTVANVQNLRLAWASDWKYWHDIFVSPNNDYIWHRNVSGGTARGWRRVVEENVSGLTNQTWSINIGGTAANVTGTVAIANGGTGATTRLNAVKALTNENVGTGTQYFLTITQNWGKAGYCSVADAKTALGLGNYVTLADNQTITGKKYITSATAYRNNSTQLGATPSNNIANYLEFVDKDGAQSAYIARWHWNNGWSDLFFDVSEKFKNGAKATDGTVQHASFKIGFSPAGVPLAETNGILSTTFLSGDQDPAIKAHMSGTPRSTWNYGVSTIHSGLRNGDNLFNPIGQAYSSGNCAGLVYHHVGNNNSGNYIGIEFFGLGSSFITYRSGLTKTSGKTEYASPADLNNALWNVETTYWGTGTTNKPASSYGILLTFNREGNVHTSTSNGWLAQLGLGTDTRLYLRTKANTSGAWSAWKEFLTSHQSLSNYVTLNGAQTISGTKTFTGDLKFSTTATRGTAPSSNITARTAYYVDSAGNSIGLIGMYYNTDMSSETRIYAYKTTAATGNNIGHLGIGCDASGNVYTLAPTPAAGDNSTKIATTAFVRSATPILAYTNRSAITDAGNGNYKRASASSLYYCYFVNGSFTTTNTKVGSSGTYELQSGGVSPASGTTGTDKICGLWLKIA